jgi:penicillin amidase
MGVEIEPWQPADSFVWGEMLILVQGTLEDVELGNLARIAQVGTSMNDYLMTPYRDDRPVIIQTSDLLTSAGLPASPLASFDADQLARLLETAKTAEQNMKAPDLLTDLGFGLGGASNSFAVSGSLTETGMPLMANDPHMSINIPNLWYEVGMHCQQKSADCVYDLRGFSLAGVPGILIGHNDRIAWSLTNAFFDAADVYIERLNPDNPNQYEVNGQWQDMETRREEIIVNGQDEPEVLFAKYTRHGLVISDGVTDVAPYSDGENLYGLSLAWTALEPVRSVAAVQNVLRAQNFDDFVAALAGFDAGQQNWLYADVNGNIGLVVPGKVPIRAKGDGTLPVPGWTDEYEWTGFIPYDEMPRTFNPSTGYIVTGNNPQVRANEYPYLLGMVAARGQRAQRITDMLQSFGDDISLDEMSAAQTSNMSLGALEVLPYLDDLTFGDEDLEAARVRLLTWDGEMTMDSPEAALFNVFWVELLTSTFQDQLSADLAPDGGTYSFDTMYWLMQEPDHAWWDDIRTVDVVEDRDAIVKAAFEEGYARTQELLGADMDNWRWGDLHTMTFTNPTLGSTGISLIDDIFNRGPVSVHGSEAVPNKTGWNIRNSYVTSSVPSLRQLLDLSDLGNSRMIQAVGQSGHPGNPHYDDFIDPWRFFEYHPSNWERAAAESGRSETLILEPGE